VKINVTLVNPFVEAAMGVVKQVAGVEVRRGHQSYGGRPEPRYGVSIIIGVFGYLTGQVIYSMRTDVAEKLVEKMLAGRPPHTRKQLFNDALGELANMITGRATCLINKSEDRTLKITTPAIVTGEQLGVTLVSKPTLVLSLHTQCGHVEMNVALEERDAVSGIEESRRQENAFGEDAPPARVTSGGMRHVESRRVRTADDQTNEAQD
jgi:chemotaxis protein CheX